MTRILQTLVIIALLLGAGWYVLTSLRKPPEDPDEYLRAARVERTEIIKEVRIVGTVVPVVLTPIKSEIAGRVTDVHVESGQKVEKGDPLIELDRLELKSQIEELNREMTSTRLRMEKAERDYLRVEKLNQKEYATEQEMLDAKTVFALVRNELSIQEARFETLEEKLSKTRILAPHHGVVLNLNVTPGKVLVGANSFSQGDVPLEVADLTRLRIDAKVNEVDLAALQKGQEADVSFASIPGLKGKARIVNISPSAEKRNKQGGSQSQAVLFPVELEFTTHDERIKPGISALARIESERVDDALVVPVSAVFHDDDGAYVFRKVSEHWERQPVETGIHSYKNMQVARGLDVGDEVALGLPSAFDPRYASSQDKADS